MRRLVGQRLAAPVGAVASGQLIPAVQHRPGHDGRLLRVHEVRVGQMRQVLAHVARGVVVAAVHVHPIAAATEEGCLPVGAVPGIAGAHRPQVPQHGVEGQRRQPLPAGLRSGRFAADRRAAPPRPRTAPARAMPAAAGGRGGGRSSPAPAAGAPVPPGRPSRHRVPAPGTPPPAGGRGPRAPGWRRRPARRPGGWSEGASFRGRSSGLPLYHEGGRARQQDRPAKFVRVCCFFTEQCRGGRATVRGGEPRAPRDSDLAATEERENAMFDAPARVRLLAPAGLAALLALAACPGPVVKMMPGSGGEGGTQVPWPVGAGRRRQPPDRGRRLGRHGRGQRRWGHGSGQRPLRHGLPRRAALCGYRLRRLRRGARSPVAPVPRPPPVARVRAVWARARATPAAASRAAGRRSPAAPGAQPCQPPLGCIDMTAGAEDVCGTCGGPGQPCCAATGATACTAGYRCAAGQTGQGSTCQSCGKSGQPCCVASAASPACESPLGCVDMPGNADVCGTCGGMDQACCAGGTQTACTAPLRCIAMQGMPGKCGMCGGMGQPCCGGGGGRQLSGRPALQRRHAGDGAHLPAVRRPQRDLLREQRLRHGLGLQRPGSRPGHVHRLRRQQRRLLPWRQLPGRLPLRGRHGRRRVHLPPLRRTGRAVLYRQRLRGQSDMPPARGRRRRPDRASLRTGALTRRSAVGPRRAVRAPCPRGLSKTGFRGGEAARYLVIVPFSGGPPPEGRCKEICLNIRLAPQFARLLALVLAASLGCASDPPEHRQHRWQRRPRRHRWHAVGPDHFVRRRTSARPPGAWRTARSPAWATRPPGPSPSRRSASGATTPPRPTPSSTTTPAAPSCAGSTWSPCRRWTCAT